MRPPRKKPNGAKPPQRHEIVFILASGTVDATYQHDTAGKELVEDYTSSA
jgi:hypothetical protein